MPIKYPALEKLSNDIKALETHVIHLELALDNLLLIAGTGVDHMRSNTSYTQDDIDQAEEFIKSARGLL